MCETRASDNTSRHAGSNPSVAALTADGAACGKLTGLNELVGKVCALRSDGIPHGKPFL